MRYWDASALLPLLVLEADTPKRQQQFQEDSEVVTWWGSRVECESGLNRLQREDKLDPAGLEVALQGLALFAAAWVEIQATSVVQGRALRLLRVHPLRAADALQLAAALIAVNDAPQHFPLVCADSRLAEAARKEGFLVLE